MNKQLKVSIKLQRQKEIFNAAENAINCHFRLIFLKNLLIKTLDEQIEALSLEKYLKAKLRDYPEIANDFSFLRRYAG